MDGICWCGVVVGAWRKLFERFEKPFKTNYMGGIQRGPHRRSRGKPGGSGGVEIASPTPENAFPCFHVSMCARGAITDMTLLAPPLLAILARSP